MYNDRAFNRRDHDNRNDLTRQGDWPPLGEDRERSARPSPAGHGPGREPSRDGSPWDVRRAGPRDDGQGRGRRWEEEARREGGRREQDMPQFQPQYQPGYADDTVYYTQAELSSWGMGGTGSGGYDGWDQQQDRQWNQQRYGGGVNPQPAGQQWEQRRGQQRQGGGAKTEEQMRAELQAVQQKMQVSRRQQRADMGSLREQQDAQRLQQRQQQQQQRQPQQQQQQMCGAHAIGVSASTADSSRVLNQHPGGGSLAADPMQDGDQTMYSDPVCSKKMSITAEELANEDVQPTLKEGELLSDGRYFPLLTEMGESTGLDGEVFWCLHYWAQNNQGVLLELSCPGNGVKFSSAEVYYSVCSLVKKKGYDPQYVMATEMPTGGQTGPWKTSLAGKVAHELALDGELTIFPQDEGDRDPLELIVHVLDNEGFQIKGERTRRPAMTEEEKQKRRQRRLVMHVVHPAEMMNLRAEVHNSRMDSFQRTMSTNFRKQGVNDIGFCQARDNMGNSLCKTIIFANYPADFNGTVKEFALATVQGTKYVDMQCKMPAKLQLGGKDIGLRMCCFKESCTPGMGPRGPVSCDAGNYYMDSNGVTQPSGNWAQKQGRVAKRGVDETKKQAGVLAAAGVQGSFDLSNTIQICRAFERGRCIKYHGPELAIGHPRRCMEPHDRDKKTIDCCSILEPGHEYYSRHFTKCRYKKIGEPCQYNCKNEANE